MTTTRRVFLKVVGAGAGAMCAGALPLGCGAAAGPVAAGNIADLAEGQIAQVADAGILIGRDTGGIYAMTATCTHQGCDLSDVEVATISDTTITCAGSCGHGSQFDANGAVVTGPAAQPLQHWKVAVADNGDITVEVGTAVDADERVAVAAAVG